MLLTRDFVLLTSRFCQVDSWYVQGGMIRLPDCPWQSIVGLGDHNLQKNCPTGQVQIISKLTLSLLHKLQTSKIVSYLATIYQQIQTF